MQRLLAVILLLASFTVFGRSTNGYTRAVYLNGERLDRNYITHDEIVLGGELRFEMTKEKTTK
jgi:putative alpha-1,2-mannosidase